MNPLHASFLSSSVAADSNVILVVEDEDIPRRCFVTMLRRLGFPADVAVSGEDALGQFDPLRHRLVLTDHRMPGMSGAELAKRLKQRSPSTPVLLCSGYPPSEPGCVDAILEKPFTLGSLQETLAALLAMSSDTRNATEVIA